MHTIEPAIADGLYTAPDARGHTRPEARRPSLLECQALPLVGPCQLASPNA